jgi:mannose-6-phosphate isomerase-like protein (cupin superfamily)
MKATVANVELGCIERLRVVTYVGMNQCLCIATLVVALSPSLVAQAPQPPAQPPATPAPAPAKPPAQRTAPRANPGSSATALTVQVTDKSGNGIGDVAVAASGPVDRSGRTAADGKVAFSAVRGGTYRLRFEHEGYVTLERELVVGPRATDVSVALNPAPKPAAAPPPPVAPPPVQTAPPSNRAVDPRTLSIPDFFERNAIGSEPQKTSLLGCTDGGAARLLQIKDPLTDQVNPDADQVLYIVGGNGTFRVRDQDYKTAAGSFLLIPRGATFSARRVGRNAIVALAVTMGEACTETGPLAK